MDVAPDLDSAIAKELLDKIEAKTATVCVVGLGYVGLPLALAFTAGGFTVLAYDTDASKIDALKR